MSFMDGVAITLIGLAVVLVVSILVALAFSGVGGR